MHLSRAPRFLECHEGRTLCAVARSIARLKAFDYAGPHDRVRPYDGSLFFVPDDTLVRADADALGVRSVNDLFGGIVPHPFVQTKVISHPLIDRSAARPNGWSTAFTAGVQGVVLPGYSAFARENARRAAQHMLQHGVVRAKPPRAAGGRGQRLLRSMHEADALLADIDDRDLATHGLVFELHLDDATTLSLGRVTLDDATIAYYGRQRQTRDNADRSVYGGSELTCVRGGWTALEQHRLDEAVRAAVRQVRVYDDAMSEYGVIASRRNYDVGQGVDAQRRPRSGVFEASWRAGGATPAEVAALEAFAADPALEVVHASTVEAYGRDAVPPRGAAVQFHGDDPDAGPVLRYSMVRATPTKAS